MKTLYIQCNMGAAGDMLSAALLELIPDPEGFVRRFNELGIPGVTMVKESAEKCGITGTRVRIVIDGEEEGDTGHHHHHHHHHHTHRGMDEIRHIIEDMPLDKDTRADVTAVYESIAAAESEVHGVPVSEIHFHEVGTMDAIADVTAVCMLMREIAPGRVVVSPVHVGSGTVRCAHGILPVPAPATALLLKGVPVYGGDIKGELCTPTGAALLTRFADSFGPMPVMTVEKTGYGMGKKDFEEANCVRAFLGEAGEPSPSAAPTPFARGADAPGASKRTRQLSPGELTPEGEVAELSCNIDDMTAEEIAFACEELMSKGALDVWTVPIGMKKGRPGTMLQVLCDAGRSEEMAELIFRYTATIGIRENIMKRYTLDRRETVVKTPEGDIRRKDVSGYGVARSKYEYEDLAEIARNKGISISEAHKSFIS